MHIWMFFLWSLLTKDDVNTKCLPKELFHRKYRALTTKKEIIWNTFDYDTLIIVWADWLSWYQSEGEEQHVTNCYLQKRSENWCEWDNCRVPYGIPPTVSYPKSYDRKMQKLQWLFGVSKSLPLPILGYVNN